MTAKSSLTMGSPRRRHKEVEVGDPPSGGGGGGGHRDAGRLSGLSAHPASTVLVALVTAALWTLSVVPLSWTMAVTAADSLQAKTTISIEVVRSHCTYPCECGDTPVCRPGVHLVKDGCDCCYICARQQGDTCDGTHLCDSDRGLVCEYGKEGDVTGICRVIRGASCTVGEESFSDGESFTLDCRTQCTCQNGTYGCVSLCSHEDIRPSANCRNPRLVNITGQCCREWMCDGHNSQTIDLNFHPDQRPPSEMMESPSPVPCERTVTDWSPCSASCGVGISVRLNNDNRQCRLTNDSRLCWLRPCPELQLHHSTAPIHGHPHHRLRRHHECRATIRELRPKRLRYGNCTSLRHYRMKYCGLCTAQSQIGSQTSTGYQIPQDTDSEDKTIRPPFESINDPLKTNEDGIIYLSGHQVPKNSGCCTPRFSTTVRVDFECPARNHQPPPVPLEDQTVFLTYPVMSIIRCECRSHCVDLAYLPEHGRHHHHHHISHRHHHHHRTITEEP